MYIGNIAGIGEIALAGVGVCGPVITMVGSVASLIGVGGAPLMSIRLGEGRKEAARDIVANAFLMLCVFGLALTGLLFAVRRPMLLFFGASEATIPYAETYFSWYLIGTVLFAAGHRHEPVHHLPGIRQDCDVLGHSGCGAQHL